MAYKKTYRKKRTTRRPARKPRRRVAAATKYRDVHSFKLTGSPMSISSSGAATGPVALGAAIGIEDPTQTSNGSTNSWEFGGSFGFQMVNTLQMGQLKTFFDQYKIDKVKLTFYPSWSQNLIQGGGFLPQMKLVRDYDDNSYPTVGDVWAREGVLKRLEKPFSITVKPQLVVPLLGGQTTMPARFLDMANVDTPHFGLKFAIRDWYGTPSSATVSSQTLRIETTYFVTVRKQIRIQGTLPVTEVDADGVIIDDPDLVPAVVDVEEVPCEDK